MDLDEFEFKQLKAILEAEGMRLLLSHENFEEIKGFIPDKGTFLFCEDKDAFLLGDGINPIEKLSFLPLEEIEEEEVKEIFSTREVNPLTIKTASDLWEDLENICPFKMLSYALPSPLLEEFINQKPDNFTFFLGEEVPKESPLKNFLEKFPNLAGLFMRNYNHGSDVDPNGNRDFTKIQEDQFINHKHNMSQYKKPLLGWISYKPLGGDVTYISSLNLPNHQLDNPLKFDTKRGGGEILTKGSYETRPLNFSNLFLMRIY